jgi:hypothetical protein
MLRLLYVVPHAMLSWQLEFALHPPAKLLSPLHQQLPLLGATRLHMRAVLQ